MGSSVLAAIVASLRRPDPRHFGVDACTSRLREVEWYIEELAALGFADIRVLLGAFDIVVATRA